MRLTSWEKKGLAWGEPAELTGLLNCIKNLKDKNIKLVNVIHVMLVRRVLPCQRRAFNLWEFVPTEHQTLRKALWHEAQRRMEGAVQGLRSTSSHV